jgi:ribonuclease BN (tRNA processing enzyme)
MHTKPSLLSRRSCLGFGALGTMGALLPGLLRTRTAMAQQPVPARGVHLVLLGTQGGPNYSAERAETANAIVVDGTPYVIDLGEGGLLAMRKAGIGMRSVAHLFLTHLHDDHTADVASFLSHQWTDGRVAPTMVLGPVGTTALVTAALQAAAANTAIRLVDEGRKINPSDVFSARDLEATATPVQVFKDERVTVHSVENTHFPEESKQRMPYRSLSYRFDCPGRSIVMSGDTAYSKGLVELARGADVLVCEAMEVASERQEYESRVAKGAYADNPEGVWTHIAGTHTSTVVAGRMAAEAGVKTLVLSHLLPGSLLTISDEAYVKGVREHFKGEVIVGKDLMVI